MAFDKFEFTKDWTETDNKSLRYFPTHQDSETRVREDQQLLYNELKNAIHALVDALASASAAEHIGVDEHDSLADALNYIYEEMTRIENDVKNLAGGDAPEAVRSKEVGFTEDSWTAVGDSYVLVIPESQHTRADTRFGYQIWALVDGAYRSDTWYGSGTCVEYLGDKSIQLTAEEPYDGRIAFFGV